MRYKKRKKRMCNPKRRPAREERKRDLGVGEVDTAHPFQLTQRNQALSEKDGHFESWKKTRGSTAPSGPHLEQEWSEGGKSLRAKEKKGDCQDGQEPRKA